MELSQKQLDALAKIEVIAIGSSAGGIEALKVVLPAVHADLRAAVVVVQHIGAKSSSTLMQFFQTVCSAPVKEVEDKEEVQKGFIYFAPAGYHVLLESNGTFSLSVDAPVSFSRPSIDVMMESAADAYRSKVMGIVLTGANQDGAEGLAAIRAVCGFTVVQNPKNATFEAMPAAALLATPDALVLDLKEMPELISNLHRDNFAKEI